MDVSPKLLPHLLEHTISSSPLSRYATTAKQLSDVCGGYATPSSLARKALRLGTALKFTDINVLEAREREGFRGIDEILREREGVGSYENFYAADPSRLSLDSQQLLWLRQAIRTNRKRRRAEEEEENVFLGGR